jgi:hypothetical protein
MGAWIPALWILFDVAICLRTGYMTAPFPRWEWWLWLCGGIVLAVLALLIERHDRKASDRQIGDLKNQVTTANAYQSGKLDLIGAAIAQIAITAKVNPSEPPQQIAAAVTSKIALLESKVAGYEGIFWKPLGTTERKQLIDTLTMLGRHWVRLVAVKTTDCIELARDLRECFEAARWQISNEPLAQTHMDIMGSSGLVVFFQKRDDRFNKIIFEALVRAVHGSVTSIIYEDTAAPDVQIVLGTKRPAND